MAEPTIPAADAEALLSRGPSIVALDWMGIEDPYNPGLDFPTAWAIQREVGPSLEHDPRCSSVSGWHPMSGPGLLCDCGAVAREHERRQQHASEAAPVQPDGHEGAL